MKPLTPAFEVMAAIIVASVSSIAFIVSGGTVLQRGSPSPNFLFDFSHMHQPRSARRQLMGRSSDSRTSSAPSIMSKPESSPAM